MNGIKPKPLQPQKYLKSLILITKKCFLYSLGDYLSTNWNYKKNLKFYAVLVLIFSSGFFYGYSGYQNRKILSDFLLYACLILIDVVALQRVTNLCIHQPDYVQAFENTLEFIQIWEHDSVAFPVLMWYYSLLHRIVILITIIMQTLSVLLMNIPIIYYLLTGKMVLVYQLFIPYIDYTTHPGWEIHVIYHLFCTFLMVLTVNGTTNTILIFLVQNCVIIDVIRARLYLLREAINKIKPNEEEITELLKSIFDNHQTLIDFIDTCEDLL